MTPTMHAVLLWAAPALVAAKLISCPALPGVETGVAPCSGPVLNTDCPFELRIECDNMYPPEFFSDSGIPCGAAAADACPMDVAHIAFPNPDYPMEAFEVLADAITSVLEEGDDNSDDLGLFDTTADPQILLERETTLNITFFQEGACDRNTLGFTTFSMTSPNLPTGDVRDINFTNRRNLLNDELEFSVIFPNVDFEFCQCLHPGTPDSYAEFCSESMPELSAGTTMRLLPDFRDDPDNLVFPAGTYLSFFLAPDGFDKGYMPGDVYREMIEQVLFTTPELNDPDMILKTPGDEDLRRHAFIFQGPSMLEVPGPGGSTDVYDFSGQTFVCYEDRRRFRAPSERPPSDSDFNDLCFFLTSEEPILGTAGPTTAPSSVPSISVCAEGILSQCGNVCCAESCGRCGGCNCAFFDGGAEACCPSTILFNGIPCLAATDVGCIADPMLECAELGSGCDLV